MQRKEEEIRCLKIDLAEVGTGSTTEGMNDDHGDGDDDGKVKDMMCFMLQIAAVKPNVLCQIQVACEMLND